MSRNLNVRTIYKYSENSIAKYFVYIGDSDISNELYGGEISTPDENRPFIRLSCLDNLVLFVDKLIIIDSNSILCPLYIRRTLCRVAPFEFHSLVNNICNSLLDEYSMNIVSTNNSNFDSNNNKLFDVVFPEKLIRLLTWNEKKRKIKFDKKNIVQNIYKFNVYFAYLGTNVGSEIDKLRPVLIWKLHENKDNQYENSYFVFPISSKIPRKNYYYNVRVNINGNENIIKINDGKRINIKRILKPLIDDTTKKTYCIDEDTIKSVKDAIARYFVLK